jgi:hypothetical protein
MPPATVHNLEHLFHDLKHSNYFRVWLVLFITTFIIFWVGFGVYVKHVDNTSSVFATGFTPEFALAFPTFHFRLPGLQNASFAIVLNSINCLWNGSVPLAITQCQGYPAFAGGFANCFAVTTHNKSFTAWASNDNSGREKPFVAADPPDLYVAPARDPSRISCNFSVNPNSLGTDPNWIAWEIESLTSFTYGDNAYGDIWFPNDNIQWIMLEEFRIQGTTYWDRNRMSHLPAIPQNDTFGNSLYQTVTIMDTTTVQYYESFGFGYHSWNGLADIGGLAFALYIMKTVVMLFAGLFLENDSIFLGGREPGKDTERTPIVPS